MSIGRALLCFLLWLPFRAAAMNDTDGLYGVGIFPISRAGEASTLAIEREWVEIQLGRDARLETRRYQIVNEGPAGRFEIGWICTVNALDRHGPCTRMSVDGRAVSLAFRNGLVRDPDFLERRFQKIERTPRVEVVEKDREQMLLSLEHLDGKIAAQSWAAASVEFGAGQQRVLEVEQQRPLCSGYDVVDFVPDFRLHGERFFRRAAIPWVEFRFEIVGGSLDPELFPLRPDLVERTRVTSDAGGVVWRVRDYPVQETGDQGYYGRLPFDLSRPWVPWEERVRGVWHKATGRSSLCGPDLD